MKNYSHKNAPFVVRRRINSAFSLIEMLMALLVASLLMAALAPIMIKKSEDHLVLTGNDLDDGKYQTVEIEYNSPECEVLDAPNNICKGEFQIIAKKDTYAKVTVIGGGGGGGAAATSGDVEYKSAGSFDFTVPAGVNEIEATLVSGGGGGAAGGYAQDYRVFVTSGTGNVPAGDQASKLITTDVGFISGWAIPAVMNNKNVLVTGCGGGGGGGASTSWGVTVPGSGGGSGGYVFERVVNFANTTSTNVQIGGAGGWGGGRYAGGAGNGFPAGGGGGGGCMGNTFCNGGAGGNPPFGNGTGDRSSNMATAPIATGGGDGGLAPNQAGAAIGGAGGPGSTGTIGDASSCPNGVAPCTVWTGGASGGTYGGGGGGMAHWGGCYSGGGGGGGGATLIGTGVTYVFLAAGGGGGQGGTDTQAGCNIQGGHAYAGGGGGGGNSAFTGGGTNIRGGRGGVENSFAGEAGTGGVNASGRTGGSVSTIFGANYCNGGNGGAAGASNRGEAGLSGALKISYLNYGPGGSGGGGGQIVPQRTIKVIPGEVLTINVGAGGAGGTPSVINAAGTLVAQGYGGVGKRTTIVRKSTGEVLLRTCSSDTTCGANGGSYNGIISNAYGTNGTVTNGLSDSAIAVAGFSSQMANASNNSSVLNTNGANATTGGDGGRTTLFTLTNHCSVGLRGTNATNDSTGESATGYGGCGGGGGYAFAAGGNGAAGYAKITWNPNKIGYGGGGAAGYISKDRYVFIKLGTKVPFQIGNGGGGGAISTDRKTLSDGQNGGNTIFGTGSDTASNFYVAAGGGGGGKSPIYNSATAVISNGTGGLTPSLCKVGAKAITCQDGTAGEAAIISRGGNGSSTEFGTGGKGNAAGNGESGAGYAAGGGGAGVIINQTDSSNSQTTGGNGAPGRIIITW